MQGKCGAELAKKCPAGMAGGKQACEDCVKKAGKAAGCTPLQEKGYKDNVCKKPPELLNVGG
jgi:hypothetical protein